MAGNNRNTGAATYHIVRVSTTNMTWPDLGRTRIFAVTSRRLTWLTRPFQATTFTNLRYS